MEQRQKQIEQKRRADRIQAALKIAGIEDCEDPKYLENSWLNSRFQTCVAAGVTFKNGRRQRQTILRQMKFKDEPYSGWVELTLKKTEFNGEPAVEIWTDQDEQVGYIGKKDLPEVLCRWNAAGLGNGESPDVLSASVYGTRKNYGLKFDIFWPSSAIPVEWLELNGGVHT